MKVQKNGPARGAASLRGPLPQPRHLLNLQKGWQIAPIPRTTLAQKRNKIPCFGLSRQERSRNSNNSTFGAISRRKSSSEKPVPGTPAPTLMVVVRQHCMYLACKSYEKQAQPCRHLYSKNEAISETKRHQYTKGVIPRPFAHMFCTPLLPSPPLAPAVAKNPVF